MIFGAGLTILVQSSSVFTSTLTPLVGAGLVSLEWAYPLTLGSNIGTTTTSLLAALASKGNEKEAIQIALVHLLFNITGILFFYPVPFMRLPIYLARKLGKIVSRYRWFSILYLLFMFCILPVCIFSLSLAGPVTMYTILIPFTSIIIFITVINILQTYLPITLPNILKTWDFLPAPLRSLDPLDRLIVSCSGSCRLQKKSVEGIEVDNHLRIKETMEENNNGFESEIA